jgi:hypothetical protein
VNVAAVKKELVRRLAESPDLEGVQVLYSADEAQIDLECIYGGDAQGPISPHAFRGGGRQPRLQDASFTVHIRVDVPSGKTSESEDRAEALANVVSDYLAANPTLSDFPGLKAIAADQFEMKSAFDDDGAITVYTLQVSCCSILT